MKMVLQAWEEQFGPATEHAPGVADGIIASVDRVRRLPLQKPFGTTGPNPIWKALGFEDHAAWMAWCRQDQSIAKRSIYSLIDLADFGYGLERLISEKPEGDAVEHLLMARAHLEALSFMLPAEPTISSAYQQVFQVLENAIKGALLWSDPNCINAIGEIKWKKHNAQQFAKWLIEYLPLADDESHLRKLSPRFEDFAGARYRRNEALTRLKVVNLAVAAQFVAGTALRRLSGSSAAEIIAPEDVPSRRPQFLG